MAGGLLVLAAIVYLATRPTEEERIKKTLGRLVTAVMVKEGDNVLSRTARINSTLADVADEDVRVDVPDLGIAARGRSAIAQRAAQAGVVFQSADCELLQMNIAIDEAKTTAKVDALAVFTGVRGGARRVDRRDVHFLLRSDGGWRVTSIDVRAAE
jgi:hypothetical protein